MNVNCSASVKSCAHRSQCELPSNSNVKRTRVDRLMTLNVSKHSNTSAHPSEELAFSSACVASVSLAAPGRSEKELTSDTGRVGRVASTKKRAVISQRNTALSRSTGWASSISRPTATAAGTVSRRRPQDSRGVSSQDGLGSRINKKGDHSPSVVAAVYCRNGSARELTGVTVCARRIASPTADTRVREDRGNGENVTHISTKALT